VQVLGDVAEYIPYSTQTKAMYRLKKEAWRHFDPHFPRYGAQDLQTALVRAAVCPPPCPTAVLLRNPLLYCFLTHCCMLLGPLLYFFLTYCCTASWLGEEGGVV
jgi:hypothetical protein